MINKVLRNIMGDNSKNNIKKCYKCSMPAEEYDKKGKPYCKKHFKEAIIEYMHSGNSKHAKQWRKLHKK